MKRQLIHNIVLLIFILCLICSIAYANDTPSNNVRKINGNIIDEQAYLEMWPVQFKNKKDAEYIATGLNNGQVFQDQDTKLYQVLYGNVEITGLILVSSIDEQ